MFALGQTTLGIEGSLPSLRLSCVVVFAFLLLLDSVSAQSPKEPPKPIGEMVELGGHRIHIRCTGKGTPTVVIENGFEEYSFDWILVQSEVEKFTRVCTYDRAGYAWSEPGPKPRTFAQINLELHEVLAQLGERAPYVLVGHSFGGPVIRNYALLYPKEISGMVLAESVAEDQRVTIGKKAVRLRDSAEGKRIPAPHEQMLPSDKPTYSPEAEAAAPASIEPPFDRLPPVIQKLHLWADSQPALEDTENSERAWSPEYFGLWHAKPQAGALGSIPLIVLTRAEGGYSNDLDIPAAKLEAEREYVQAGLAVLSTNGSQRVVQGGHNLQVEVPAVVVRAIQDVVDAARRRAVH
jgi:pimeloyl-ACP methyl ester carboxylesterase